MNNNKEIFNMAQKAYDEYSIPKDAYNSPNLKRGLRNPDGSGVIAGVTKVCEVHGYVMSEGEKSPIPGELFYRGYNLYDLTRDYGINRRFGFEEVAYLLIFGKLPTKSELESFCGFLANNRELPDYFVEDMILKAPSRNIMNKMARSVLALYSYDDNPDATNIENIMRQSLQLLSQMPMISVYSYSTKKHHYDKKSLILHQPKAELSTAENLLRMLNPTKEFTKLDAEVLDLALMIHAEHGGGNNSSFTCRVLSSSGTDTYSAIGGAICSLKGPKHGGANSAVIGMMDNICENVKDWSNEAEIREYLIKILQKKAYNKTGLIYGIGHAVYTMSDPRAVILKEQAKKLSDAKGQQSLFNLYETIERIAPEVFAEVTGKDKALCANVDFYSGFLYRMLNIPEEMYTPLFAIARTAGWCAHRIEEVISGGRIIRPAYKSICKKDVNYNTIDNR